MVWCAAVLGVSFNQAIGVLLIFNFFGHLNLFSDKTGIRRSHIVYSGSIWLSLAQKSLASSQSIVNLDGKVCVRITSLKIEIGSSDWGSS